MERKGKMGHGTVSLSPWITIVATALHQRWYTDRAAINDLITDESGNQVKLEKCELCEKGCCTVHGRKIR